MVGIKMNRKGEMVYSPDKADATVTRARKQAADLRKQLNLIRAERDRYREALEAIAESHDAGRHDGLSEDCPAHDDTTMWSIARQALKGKA